MEPARPEIRLDTASAGQQQQQPTQVLRQDDGKWLDVFGEDIVDGVKLKVGVKVVDEGMPMEQAVEVCMTRGVVLMPGIARGRLSMFVGAQI